MKPRLTGILLPAVLAIVAPRLDAQTDNLLPPATAMQAGDNATALPTVKPLAEKGDKRAQYQMGRIFERGTAVPRDGAQAVHWYELSARQAFMPAERALGLLYLEGRLVPQDYDAASKWLERAAHDGSSRAQLELGKMLERGYGRAPDAVMAYVWYDFAAAQGNTVAGDARDAVAKKLSADQLEEAQRIAKQIAPSVLGASPG